MAKKILYYGAFRRGDDGICVEPFKKLKNEYLIGSDYYLREAKNQDMFEFVLERRHEDDTFKLSITYLTERKDGTYRSKISNDFNIPKTALKNFYSYEAALEFCNLLLNKFSDSATIVSSNNSK